jgi:hypothetical protein
MRRALLAFTSFAIWTAALPVRAGEDGGRWVTFKVVADSLSGKLDHQIDRNSIRQEGPFKTFQTRILAEESHNPYMHNGGSNDLVLTSQKFAVDCAGRRFGVKFIETNARTPVRPTPLAKMTWVRLDRYPAIARVVCGLP